MTINTPKADKLLSQMKCGDCGWSGSEATWEAECKGFPCELNAKTARPTQSMTKDKLRTELEPLVARAALAMRKEILLQSERGVSIIYGDADGLAAAALEAAGVKGLLLRIESLESFIDRLVEHTLDDMDGPLWIEAAKLTNRDPDTGNRKALSQ